MSVREIGLVQRSETRLSEVAALLGAAFIRMQRREREQQHCSGPEKVELDFTGDQSVCATVSKGNGRAKWQDGGA